MPYSPSDAAVKLQSAWKGYLVRKELKKPHTLTPQNYATLISGNEPSIRFPQKLDRNFVLVGTSGIKSLQLISDLAKIQPSSDGYSHVPKLFIVDYSPYVVNFWKFLKNCVAKAKNITDFIAHVLTRRFDLEKYTGGCCLSPEKVLINCICGLANLNAEPTSGSYLETIPGKENKWDFIKNVIEKATIICHDWSDPSAFAYIRQHTAPEVPIVVYASNIIEFANTCRRPMSSEESTTTIDKMLDNIFLLRPYLSIHTRTWKRTDCCHIKPDETLLLKGSDKKTHLDSLSNAKFRPLVPTQKCNASIPLKPPVSGIPPEQLIAIFLKTGKLVEVLNATSTEKPACGPKPFR